jgi:autotransporter-associated beta strand protein
VLQIGAGNLGGNLAGSVTNNAVLNFDNSATNPVSYAGAITGIGSLVKSGNGVLTLTGNNNFSGGTTINAGTLQIAGGFLFSGIGNVENSGTLTFNHPSSFVDFNGVITGSGTVNKLGTNTLGLLANNTYTGVTTIHAGTLEIGNGGPTGNIAGDIVNNASLKFRRSSASSYAGMISGSGSVTQAFGFLTFTGTNTYTGGTTVSGTLQIGNGGTAGSIVGNVNVSGNLTFNRSDDTTFRGIISGSGTVSKLGPGRLTLTGANNYAGGTTISGGTLQIGDGGTSAALGGNVTNNGALIFNNNGPGGPLADFAFDVIFNGSISGTGSVQKLGQNNLRFTGPSSYTGGTTVGAGVLRAIGSSATFGAGDVSVTGGMLYIASGAANAIADTGTLSISSPGIVNLAGTGINELVAALFLDGTPRGPGTYGSSTSGADFQLNQYFTGSGIVTVVGPGPPGDFNGDGAVDASDYVVWRKAGGAQAGFNKWRANFGATSGGTAISTTVPEPATMVVLLYALVIVYRRHAR